MQRQGHVPDLVEEQRAALGGFHLAQCLLDRAGESTFLVAEELAFQQLLRDSGAVDRNEAPGLAIAARMDRARDQFLAGPALAQDQHADAGRRHLLHHATNPLHGGIGRDDALKWRGALRVAQPFVLSLQLREVEGARDDQPQHVRVDGLGIEVAGAQAHGADRIVAVRIAGHHDDLGARGDTQHLLQRRQPFGHAVRIGRQPQVLEHHGGLGPAQASEGLRSRGRRYHGVVVEAPLELLLQPGVVLDD